MNRSKPLRMVAFLLGALAFISLPALTGCGSTGPVRPGAPASSARPDGAHGWWYESFKIAWPQGKDPAWSMDLLIAHQVVLPVLNRYRKDILLWRFHRRAVRDNLGHQFSFIFYTTAPEARKIYAALASNPVLQRLQAKGLVERVITDDTNKISRPDIEDTSDRSWSVPLQKAWPSFIMGVSQTWLELITQYVESAGQKPGSMTDMVAFYRKIGQKVDTTWRNEGGHAFLHHLNAVFGYAPLNVVVRRKVKLRF